MDLCKKIQTTAKKKHTSEDALIREWLMGKVG